MFKTKKQVQVFYKRFMPLWIIASAIPLVMASVQCIIDKSWNEMLFGGITAAVFAVMTISGYFFNLWKVKQYQNSIK